MSLDKNNLVLQHYVNIIIENSAKITYNRFAVGQEKHEDDLFCLSRHWHITRN
jgi:hypothetical protein